MRKQVIVGGMERGGNPILVEEEKKEGGFVKTFQKEGGKDYPN